MILKFFGALIPYAHFRIYLTLLVMTNCGIAQKWGKKPYLRKQNNIFLIRRFKKKTSESKKRKIIFVCYLAWLTGHFCTVGIVFLAVIGGTGSSGDDRRAWAGERRAYTNQTLYIPIHVEKEKGGGHDLHVPLWANVAKCCKNILAQRLQKDLDRSERWPDSPFLGLIYFWITLFWRGVPIFDLVVVTCVRIDAKSSSLKSVRHVTHKLVFLIWMRRGVASFRLNRFRPKNSGSCSYTVPKICRCW
jgi:hypothetical protein